MSDENLESVRWAYEEGLARRTVDLPGIEERFDPGYRFHARRGWPGRTLYRLEELTALWADLDATFSDHSMEPEGYEAIGDSHVVVTLRQAARLRGSDQRIDTTVFHVWQVEGGKIQETWTFGTRAEALEMCAQGK